MAEVTLTIKYFLSDFLTQPLLLIAGSKADIRIFSEQAYNLAKCEKERFIVREATHSALYDVPKYVEQAVNKMVEFFKVL